MNHAKRTLTEAVLARISLGAVPVGGFYWIDAKGLRHRAASHESNPAVAANPAVKASPAVKAKPKTRRWLRAKWWHLRRTGGIS